MKFIKFSLHDDEKLKLVKRYLDDQITIRCVENIREGITSFPVIDMTPQALYEELKISRTEMEGVNIPIHYHERTKHVYICTSGALTVYIYEPSSKENYNHTLFKNEGCFIPPGLPHGLGAEEAELLCIEIPPDYNDFHRIDLEG